MSAFAVRVFLAAGGLTACLHCLLHYPLILGGARAELYEAPTELPPIMLGCALQLCFYSSGSSTPPVHSNGQRPPPPPGQKPWARD